jgi:hypothetical protein
MSLERFEELKRRDRERCLESEEKEEGDAALAPPKERNAETEPQKIQK